MHRRRGRAPAPVHPSALAGPLLGRRIGRVTRSPPRSAAVRPPSTSPACTPPQSVAQAWSEILPPSPSSPSSPATSPRGLALRAPLSRPPGAGLLLLPHMLLVTNCSSRGG